MADGRSVEGEVDSVTPGTDILFGTAYASGDSGPVYRTPNTRMATVEAEHRSRSSWSTGCSP